MSDKKNLDPAVLAAVITVAGGIIITLITTFANRPSPQVGPTPFPTWTNVPTATIVGTAVPTDTVAVGESTSTPAPDTPTPEPSLTPPPPAIGEDWANNCISALWQPFPVSIQTEQENGCLKQPVGDFIVSNGQFSFLVNRRFDGGEVYGMFAPLDAEGTVSFKVHLDILESGEVWMGIFSEPSKDSTGVILYIPKGDVKKRLLVAQPLPDGKKIPSGMYDQSSAVYDVNFTYTLGTVKVTTMNNSFVINPVPVASQRKWLFIGFKADNGTNKIGAQFFDLAFK